MSYIFIKVVRKPPFSYFLKCLTEGHAKKPILGGFLVDFKGFIFQAPDSRQNSAHICP